MRNRIPIVYLVDSAGVNLPLSGRHLPRPVRRGPHLLLQLADAAEAARAADRRRHGPLHRRRRLSARVERRHRHGERHQLHGPGRPQPGEGRHRRRGIDAETLGGAAPAHRAPAESRTTRPTMTPTAWRSSGALFRDLPPPPRVARGTPSGAPARGSLLRPAAGPPPALRHGGASLPHLRCATTTWSSSRSTRRRCSAPTRGWTGIPVARGGQPPRLRQDRTGGREWAASSTPNRRGRCRTSSRTPNGTGCRWSTSRTSSGFMVGTGGRERRHHSRRRGDGGEHGLRHRAEDRPHAQPCQRRGLLRHGRTGLRSRLHLRLADGAHRRHGGRFGHPGDVWPGDGEAAGPPVSRFRRNWNAPSIRPAPITSAGWTPPTRRRAGTWMRSSIRWRHAPILSFALEVALTTNPKRGHLALDLMP